MSNSPPVTAKHGIVATTHPVAARIGVDVMKRGGNAVDAAVSASAAIGLMEPMSCGIGGDLFAIVWEAKTGRLYGLNASGRAPAAASIDHFERLGLTEIPWHGPLSWSVPGCVDGWDRLLGGFGTWSMGRVLEPSIAYAEAGVEVPATIGQMWKNAEPFLKETEEGARTYLVDGRAPAAGDVFRNPRLAETYREIAAGGRDAFYHGRVAGEIVAYSKQAGGLFERADFEEHSSEWVDPVSTTYRGHEIWQLPPPGQGIAVLEMLNLIEGVDLTEMGRGSADWWHLFVEAKKLAYADRARHYCDPSFERVPLRELISKEYAAERRRLIDMGRSAERVACGDFKLRSDTIYLCAVDGERNCVSLIQSNYHGFGSRRVAGDLGFALQNRGTLFSLDRSHPNQLEPRKRPFHTIIPGFVTKDGRPHLVYGVMGGDMQPQGHVQVLVNQIDFGLDIQAAGDEARVEHVGSASPKGTDATGGGEVLAEPGIPQAVIDELARRGHKVSRTAKNGGAYQAILLDWEHDVLHGASESRRDGIAAGY